MLDQHAIVKQIDEVLASSEGAEGGRSESTRALTAIVSALRRLAPLGSTYANSVEGLEENLRSGSLIAIAGNLDHARGTLLSLKREYESGYLESVVELVHADVFADFLDMVHYLLEHGYKDPAAVVMGSVLEVHLRKLCNKHNIPVHKTDDSPKTAETLNSELRAAGAYEALDQKNVTAWLGLRNKAAHAHYDQYTKEQVELTLENIRNFILRVPA